MRWCKPVVMFWVLLLWMGLSFSVGQDRTGLHLSTLYKEKLWSPQIQSHVNITNPKHPVVLVLLSPDCPMCISYTQLLKRIRTKYDQEIELIGIIPGRTYQDSVVLKFVDKYELNFPVYVDKKLKVSRYLKAELTPECFLFDQKGMLVYSGAIDNWLTDLGKKRLQADQHYLLDALSQTHSGIPLLFSYVKPQGCLLNEY
jgi:hypothetical protein